MCVDEETDRLRRLPHLRAVDRVAVEVNPQRQRTGLRPLRNREVSGDRPVPRTGHLDVVDGRDRRLLQHLAFEFAERHRGELLLRLFPVRVEIGRFRHSLLQSIRRDAAGESVLHVATVAPFRRSAVGIEQYRLDHHETGLIQRSAHHTWRLRLHFAFEGLLPAVVARADDPEFPRFRLAVVEDLEGEHHLLAGSVHGILPVGRSGDETFLVIGHLHLDDLHVAEPDRTGNRLQPEREGGAFQLRQRNPGRAGLPRQRPRRVGRLRVVMFSVGIDERKHHLDAVPRFRRSGNILLLHLGGEHHTLPRQQRRIHRNRNLVPRLRLRLDRQHLHAVFLRHRAGGGRLDLPQEIRGEEHLLRSRSRQRQSEQKPEPDHSNSFHCNSFPSLW